LWCPWTERDCETLEKVQRRAVNMVSDLKGKTYEEKLKEAGTKIKTKRKKEKIIETFKIMKGISKVKKETWFKVVTGEDRMKRTTRQNSQVKEDGEMESRGDIIVQQRARMEI
jgi:hypothetical protein